VIAESMLYATEEFQLYNASDTATVKTEYARTCAYW